MDLNTLHLKMKWRNRTVWLVFLSATIIFLLITYLTFLTVQKDHKTKQKQKYKFAADIMSLARRANEKAKQKTEVSAYDSDVKEGLTFITNISNDSTNSRDNDIFGNRFGNVLEEMITRPSNSDPKNIDDIAVVGRTEIPADGDATVDATSTTTGQSHKEVTKDASVSNKSQNADSLKNVALLNNTDRTKTQDYFLMTVAQSPATSTSKQIPDDPRSLASNGSTENIHIEAVHKQRVHHLRKICDKYAIPSKKNPSLSFRRQNFSNVLAQKKVDENFYADESRHLVYCAVEKVGSSFWKRVFRILNRLEPAGSLFNQSGLSTHVLSKDLTFINKTAEWKAKTLQTSKKFLFVRHPFARTFSAYMDKIFILNMNAVQSGRPEQQKDMSLPNNHKNQCKLSIPSFSQFINESFTESTPGVLLSRNPHFTAIHRHCTPCKTRFDMVGKMESFRQDTEFILHQAGLTLADVVDDPETFDARSDLGIMSEIALRTLMGQAWRILGERGCWTEREEVLRRVWTVYKVRGLISAHLPLPFTVAAQSDNETLAVLTQEIKKAYDVSEIKEQRLQQRDAAMAEAFRSVSSESMAKLQAFHKGDCDLFDYDCTQQFLVHLQGNSSSNVSFFKDWW